MTTDITTEIFIVVMEIAVLNVYDVVRCCVDRNLVDAGDELII